MQAQDLALTCAAPLTQCQMSFARSVQLFDYYFYFTTSNENQTFFFDYYLPFWRSFELGIVEIYKMTPISPSNMEDWDLTKLESKGGGKAQPRDLHWEQVWMSATGNPNTLYSNWWFKMTRSDKNLFTFIENGCSTPAYNNNFLVLNDFFSKQFLL